MQFLVIGHDGKDEGALQRRLDNRDAHIASAKSLKEQGIIIEAGAMLDDNEKMIGSAVLFETESREQLDKFIANDPYTLNGVWVSTEITEIRLAFRN